MVDLAQVEDRYRDRVRVRVRARARGWVRGCSSRLCMVDLAQLLLDLQGELLAVGALDAQHTLLDAAVGVDDKLELLVRVRVGGGGEGGLGAGSRWAGVGGGPRDGPGDSRG
jgi:hypothetical protein